MKVNVSVLDVMRSKADALVFGIFEETKKFEASLAAIDSALQNTLKKMVGSKEISGKSGDLSVVHTLGLLPSKKVVLVGLGKEEKVDEEKIRRAAACVVRSLNASKTKSAVFTLLSEGAGIKDKAIAQAIAEGAILANYRFAIRKENDDPTLNKITITADRERKRDLVKAAEVGRIFAESTNFARDLANAPPQDLTPDILSQRAMELAQKRRLEIEIYGPESIQEMKMGALWAVGKGSDESPRFIVMKYRGAGDETPIGLVGKGVTFDSGGLSLKPASGMEEMKGDMSGAAAVLGAMDAIAQLKPKVNVTMLVPTVENMPSSKAYRPGDIITAMNGKTIEVLNTDAEGRLILADALCYAKQLGLDPVIDLATLTGSCAVALGPICTGAFSNDPELVGKVIEAGKQRGEPIWHMPLTEYEEYADLIKSDFADIKNIGGRVGGSITAACFLHHFIEGTSWCHLDIASTMSSSKDQHYIPKGMSGVGARTCAQFVLNQAKS